MTSAYAEANYSVAQLPAAPRTSWLDKIRYQSNSFSMENTDVAKSIPDTSCSVASGVISSIKTLFAAAADAANSGWDGYDALPVSSRTLWNALSLIGSLPRDTPPPSIEAHPDGEIGLEWYVDKDHVLTMSIDASGIISYAVSIGFERLRGREFLRAAFPETVGVALTRLMERSAIADRHAFANG